MKSKLLYIIASLFLFFTCFTTAVSAEILNDPSDAIETEILFEAKEITDKDVLYKKALEEKKSQQNNNKSSSSSINKGRKVTATMEIEDKSKVLDSMSTTQFLKSVKRENIVENTYAVTTFVNVSPKDFEPVSVMASSYKPGSLTDGGISVKSSATIYYTESVIGGISHIKLNKVDTSWQVLDPRTYIENRRLRMAAQGTNAGIYLDQVDVYRYQNLNSSVTYYAPTSWKPVADNIRLNLGVSTYVDMTRGSYKGTFAFHLRY